MRRSLAFGRRLGVALAAVLGLAVAGLGAHQAAQGAAAPSGTSSLVQLIIVDVEPEAWDDYVALQKADAIPALLKAGIEGRSAWVTQGFGPAFRVAYIYPIKSFGVFDEAPPMTRALGEAGAKAYYAKMRRLIEGSRSFALRRRDDLGFTGDPAAAPKLGVLAHVQVIPGRQADFEAVLKNEWAPALRKAGVPLYSVHEVLFGGDLGEYYTFTPIDKFATLDAGHPIMRSLGPGEYNALLGKLGATLSRVERTVMKLDDDLSFAAKK